MENKLRIARNGVRELRTAREGPFRPSRWPNKATTCKAKAFWGVLHGKLLKWHKRANGSQTGQNARSRSHGQPSGPKNGNRAFRAFGFGFARV